MQYQRQADDSFRRELMEMERKRAKSERETLGLIASAVLGSGRLNAPPPPQRTDPMQNLQDAAASFSRYNSGPSNPSSTNPFSAFPFGVPPPLCHHVAASEALFPQTHAKIPCIRPPLAIHGSCTLKSCIASISHSSSLAPSTPPLPIHFRPPSSAPALLPHSLQHLNSRSCNLMLSNILRIRRPIAIHESRTSESIVTGPPRVVGKEDHIWEQDDWGQPRQQAKPPLRLLTVSAKPQGPSHRA